MYDTTGDASAKKEGYRGSRSPDNREADSRKSRPVVVRLRRSVPLQEPSLRYFEHTQRTALGKGDEVVDLPAVSRPRTRNAFQLLKSFKLETMPKDREKRPLVFLARAGDIAGRRFSRASSPPRPFPCIFPYTTNLWCRTSRYDFVRFFPLPATLGIG